MSFGSNKSKNESQQSSIQESFNQAYPDISNAFSGLMNQVGGTTSQIRDLLGLGGEGAQNSAFQNFLNNSAYGSIRDQGLKSITSNAALGGLLSSGSTLKGATNFSNDLTRQYLNEYLQQLTGLNSQALQAGNLIGSAGQVSKGSSQGASSGSASGFNFGLR